MTLSVTLGSGLKHGMGTFGWMSPSIELNTPPNPVATILPPAPKLQRGASTEVLGDAGTSLTRCFFADPQSSTPSCIVLGCNNSYLPRSQEEVGTTLRVLIGLWVEKPPVGACCHRRNGAKRMIVSQVLGEPLSSGCQVRVLGAEQKGKNSRK